MKEIVVVSAVWCPSCLILNKHLKKLSVEKNININKLYYYLDEYLVEEYNVGDKLPVIILKENNNELRRLIGEKSYDEIIEFIGE